jgi:hypothetical protein
MTLSPKHYLLPIALAAAFTGTVYAQQEGPTVTQALVAIDAKASVVPTPSNVTVKVDNRSTPITQITRVLPTGAQVALLIDDGLRSSVARELGSLRTFVQSLPAGTEIFVGYMQNGRVVPAQAFTTDFAAASHSLRSPLGSPGLSASPYFCLSDFVKNWPRNESDQDPAVSATPGHKARFVLMITNGVDPYNGSTSPLNQDSPYVSTAIADAQRAGVPVYSIYFSDAGFRGEGASFSGQGYLTQLADGTGGRAYYQGTGNPVSMAPFLKEFQHAVAETYIATFNAPGDKNLVRLKLSTSLPGTKLRSTDQVRPGSQIATVSP